MKRILCIWFPNWPIQRLIVARPELKQQVIILHMQHAHHGQRVVTCSRAAQQHGVRSGMPLTEALTFADRWKQVPSSPPSFGNECSNNAVPRPFSHIATYDPHTDWKQLQELARYSQRFSPIVGFERHETTALESTKETNHPSCLYLDVTRLTSHFGGDNHMAQHVAESFEQQGYYVRAALATTLGAAWAAAHFATRQATHPNGSGTQSQPSHYLVIDPDNITDAIHGLPIESLRLSPHVVNLLQQLGIFTVKQLTKAPRTGLPSRFGDEVLTRWDQVTGLVDELMVPYKLPPVFQADCSIEYPTKHCDAIRHILQELIQRVTHALIAGSQGALELVCTLRCRLLEIPDTDPSSHITSQTLCLQLSLPTHCSDHLLELMSMQLDRQSLPGPVEHISLKVPVTAPLEQRQQKLFSELSHSLESHIARFINLLSTRLGSQAVTRPKLINDFQPEKSFFFQDVLTSHSSPPSPTSAASSTSPHLIPWTTRPLFLTTPPLPLEVVALADNGPPAQLRLADKLYRVIKHWGPERIETGWWRDCTVRRDYFRVETECGQHFWVFRQLTDGQWFMHGSYG